MKRCMTSLKSPPSRQADSQQMDCQSIGLEYRDLLLFTAQSAFQFPSIDNHFNKFRPHHPLPLVYLIRPTASTSTPPGANHLNSEAIRSH